MTIRPIRSPREVRALVSLDTSFCTSHIFRVICEGSTFSLTEEMVTPPILKSYPLIDLSDDVAPSDHTLLARVAVWPGVSMRFEAWNRRSLLRHLYVAPASRRRGVGGALVNAISSLSDSLGSRCLWVETQNVNHPAIQFYLRLGFKLCGFDTSLYDLRGRSTEEIGLFFARFVGAPLPNQTMQPTP